MEAIENATQSAALNILISEYEQERGKPTPGKNHGYAQAELAFAFKYAYRKEFSVFAETSITLNGERYTPDILIYQRMVIDWKHDEISLTEPPLTTIEIISPTQALADLIDKSEDYFSGGVKSCWIVLPMLETILVMQSNRMKIYFQRGDMLTDPATGITLAVDSIFSE